MVTETLARNLHELVADPHEFATAYADHVEQSQQGELPPLPVGAAVRMWTAVGSLNRTG